MSTPPRGWVTNPETRLRPGFPPSSHQAVSFAREEVVDLYGLGEDALLERRRDELIEHVAVGLHAIGQGVLARDFHHALVRLVRGGHLLDAAGLELLDIQALGF